MRESWSAATYPGIDPRDVKKRVGGNVDVIAAGPPCQGFSTLGRRDPDDERNAMFRHLVRFVETFSPGCS